MSKAYKYLYSRLPSLYKQFDTENLLSRFLEVLAIKGFDVVIDETLKLENLADPMKCPIKYFPYLCETYGIPYFHDIDELFQRRILYSLVDLYKIKGTKSCIQYLGRQMLGSEVSLVRISDYNYNLTIPLFESTGGTNLALTDPVSRYIQMFSPVNVTINVSYLTGYDDTASHTSTYQDYYFKLIDQSEEVYYNTISQVITEVLGYSDTEDFTRTNITYSGVTKRARIGLNFRTNYYEGKDSVTAPQQYAIYY